MKLILLCSLIFDCYTFGTQSQLSSWISSCRGEFNLVERLIGRLPGECLWRIQLVSCFVVRFHTALTKQYISSVSDVIVLARWPVASQNGANKNSILSHACLIASRVFISQLFLVILLTLCFVTCPHADPLHQRTPPVRWPPHPDQSPQCVTLLTVPSQEA